jgi:hypothetical protein
MKFLIMQFSPTSCHFISLWSKYSPQHSVLKHPQSLYLLYTKTSKIVDVQEMPISFLCLKSTQLHHNIRYYFIESFALLHHYSLSSNPRSALKAFSLFILYLCSRTFAVLSDGTCLIARLLRTEADRITSTNHLMFATLFLLLILKFMSEIQTSWFQWNSHVPYQVADFFSKHFRLCQPHGITTQKSIVLTIRFSFLLYAHMRTA